MISTLEKEITFRFLKARKKDGFLNVISIFSFIGISLGVAVLIIVMSVMNGFKTDLTNKILGLNPHIVIQPNGFEIDDNFISKIKEDFKELSISKSYNGEGIILSKNNAKGVILKGVDKKEKKIKEFFKNYIFEGKLSNFDQNNVLIGSELAYNLNLNIGSIR